jgi:hypothetical protein
MIGHDLRGRARPAAAIGRTDDQVCKAVPIDVARRRSAPACIITRNIALDDETLGLAELGEVDYQ